MSQRIDPRSNRLTSEVAQRKRQTDNLVLRNKNRDEQQSKRRHNAFVNEDMNNESLMPRVSF